MSTKDVETLNWEEIDVLRSILKGTLRISFTGIISRIENNEGFGSIEKESEIIKCKGMTEACMKIQSIITKWSDQSAKLNDIFEFSSNNYEENSKLIDEHLSLIINHVNLISPKD